MAVHADSWAQKILVLLDLLRKVSEDAVNDHKNVEERPLRLKVLELLKTFFF